MKKTLFILYFTHYSEIPKSDFKEIKLREKNNGSIPFVNIYAKPKKYSKY